MKKSLLILIISGCLASCSRNLAPHHGGYQKCDRGHNHLPNKRLSLTQF
ncbi:MAG: hypothetical protein ACR2KB_13635 [Chitinophagaceae bacterium]